VVSFVVTLGVEGEGRYLKGRLQFHGSATEPKLEPSTGIALEIDEDFIPNLVVIRKLESYVYPIRVEFVDRIVLWQWLSIKTMKRNPDIPRPRIHPHTSAGAA
jgi:hypothetical protein